MLGVRSEHWEAGFRELSSPSSCLPVLSLYSLTFPCSSDSSCQPPILSGQSSSLLALDSMMKPRDEVLSSRLRKLPVADV